MSSMEFSYENFIVGLSVKQILSSYRPPFANALVNLVSCLTFVSSKLILITERTEIVSTLLCCLFLELKIQSAGYILPFD